MESCFHVPTAFVVSFYWTDVESLKPKQKVDFKDRSCVFYLYCAITIILYS